MTQLEQKINDGIKAAMLAKDKVRLESLRAIKAAILLEKTSGSGVEATDESDIKMLQKLVKQRREAADMYKQNNRTELADKEMEEAAVIEEFLPAQMSESEIEEELKKIIAETGATSAKDMGKVMGEANKRMAGKADGKLIGTLAKKLL